MKFFAGSILALTLLALAESPGAAAESARLGGLGSPKRSRVVVVEEKDALVTFATDAAKVRTMLDRGLTRLTSQKTVRDAWRSLVKTNDRVGLKVFSTPGEISGTRPAVVSAVVQGLLESGLPRTNIIIWDRRQGDLIRAGYGVVAARFGVRLAGASDAGYDEKVFYDNALLGKLIWGDHEFGKQPEGNGRRSYVSKLVTQGMTKIISLAPMLSHNSAGVSGHLYGLGMGCVDNTIRFENDLNALAVAVPEVWALPSVGDRVVLNITDALICQYEGEEKGLLHYSTILNQLHFSTDPVALDTLSIQEINRHRTDTARTIPKATMELYTNANLLELGQNEVKNITIENAEPPKSP